MKISSFCQRGCSIRPWSRLMRTTSTPFASPTNSHTTIKQVFGRCPCPVHDTFTHSIVPPSISSIGEVDEHHADRSSRSRAKKNLWPTRRTKILGLTGVDLWHKFGTLVRFVVRPHPVWKRRERCYDAFASQLFCVNAVRIKTMWQILRFNIKSVFFISGGICAQKMRRNDPGGAGLKCVCERI